MDFDLMPSYNYSNKLLIKLNFYYFWTKLQYIFLQLLVSMQILNWTNLLNRQSCTPKIISKKDIKFIWIIEYLGHKYKSSDDLLWKEKNLIHYLVNSRTHKKNIWGAAKQILKESILNFFYVSKRTSSLRLNVFRNNT